MLPTPENSLLGLDPVSRSCLDRTRSAVLNVLVGIGLFIAVSGWLLRSRALTDPPRGSRSLHEGLTIGLVILSLASFLTRRTLGRRASLDDPVRRGSRFFWSRVLPALIAALAAPLGLVYGWLVVPRVEFVIPFWVVSLALGFLDLPREHELMGFERPMHGGGVPSQ
jgi:hypothetical protein